MNPPTLKLLARALQTYTLRLQTVASNLANLDTPGYRRMTVSFEETLQDARRSIAGPRSAEDIKPRVSVEDGAPILEDEMMNLADTQMRTQLVSRALQSHYNKMRIGITGRTG